MAFVIGFLSAASTACTPNAIPALTAPTVCRNWRRFNAEEASGAFSEEFWAADVAAARVARFVFMFSCPGKTKGGEPLYSSRLRNRLQASCFLSVSDAL